MYLSISPNHSVLPNSSGTYLLLLKVIFDMKAFL